ncbi:hypothetical protein FRACA_400006 [Frankia canadensis]|uniref:Uncharacterized protein n=1 Tax=Frankia canadensis TaxID=1836972 RepID=A0A2I2KWL4_9ACTN|nr:hypothetical protein FRACA_400006 [Frankia canadensis]SOU57363.1 hypothetical protein FRACA_400006 [Frankia canadensis]
MPSRKKLLDSPPALRYRSHPTPANACRPATTLLPVQGLDCCTPMTIRSRRNYAHAIGRRGPGHVDGPDLTRRAGMAGRRATPGQRRTDTPRNTPQRRHRGAVVPQARDRGGENMNATRGG